MDNLDAQLQQLHLGQYPADKFLEVPAADLQPYDPDNKLKSIAAAPFAPLVRATAKKPSSGALRSSAFTTPRCITRSATGSWHAVT